MTIETIFSSGGKSSSLPNVEGENYAISNFKDDLDAKKIYLKSENQNEPFTSDTYSWGNDIEKIFENLIVFPSYKDSKDNFIALQKWEGYILEVNKTTFIARLSDLTNSHANEDVEIEIEEVPMPDREMLTKGAYFYWCIGYYDSPGGQRSRQSQIRFKREPVWQKNSILKAKLQAEELGKTLDW